MVLYQIFDIDWIIQSHILVSSEGIIILQKYLFSHTLLRDLSLVFVLKEWRQFGPFDVVPLNYVNSFLLQDKDLAFCPLDLASIPCPFGIIKRITCFSQFELCFETYAEYILSFLTCTILESTVTLFFSHFSQASFYGEKFTPSHLYLFTKAFFINLFYKSFDFYYLSRIFPISSWFNAYATAYLRHLLSFLWMGFIVTFCFLSN